MRALPLGERTEKPVPARVPLLVLARLEQERVEVEPAGGHPSGHHHQRAARDERVAARERAGAVGRQLRRARPLQQHGPHRPQRQADHRGEDAAEQEQDLQRRLVEDVLGEDVAELVPEQRPHLVGVEHLHELRGDEHDRPSGADRHRVRPEREVRHVEVGELRQVERLAGALVHRPDLGQLLRPELDGVREQDLAQGPLVLQLRQLAHDLADAGDLPERGRRGPVRRVLERPRRDLLQPVQRRLRHGRRLP
jgi:hypothetical protein